MQSHDPLSGLTPLVELPNASCSKAGCTAFGVNLVLIEDQYELRCPKHTPAPPTLIPPQEGQ